MLYDDFDQKVTNIHDEMDLHHSYIKKKKCTLEYSFIKKGIHLSKNDVI